MGKVNEQANESGQSLNYLPGAQGSQLQRSGGALGCLLFCRIPAPPEWQAQTVQGQTHTFLHGGSKRVLATSLSVIWTQGLLHYPLSQLPLLCSPILVLFHHFQPLQGLEDPTGHALGASAEVAGHDTISLPPSVDLGHGADPSTTPEVQVPCCGGWEGCKGDLRTILR